MTITNLNSYLSHFFEANHCEVISNQEGILKVQLTERMDRALMNRPFYWHYIKKIGKEGQPQQLTLITNKHRAKEEGELIHFGSPRLQQIMDFLTSNERFIKLYQNLNPHEINTPLHPWLLVNIKVTYIGRLQKEEVFSIGLNLVNGMMKTNMMEFLNTIPLQNHISDYCYTISPLIKLNSGFKRIESVIQNYLTNQPHDWAEESTKKLNEEINLLAQFYTNPTSTEKEQINQTISEIKNRYEPRIKMSVINGGMVYLKQT